MDLVKSLAKFYDEKVTGILINYVQQLLQENSSSISEERRRDACIYLVIAMSVRAQTRMQGVTQCNPLVPVADFYKSQILPCLTSKPITNVPILRAACIKYVTTFRNQLGAEFQTLLPHICDHIEAESAVLHTYSAHCIEKILSLPNNSLDIRKSKDHLLQMSSKILKTLMENKGIPQNEYLMRCVVRIFNYLQAEASDVCTNTVQLLVAILRAVCANPINPMFNHYLFEAIAVIVKVGAEGPALTKAERMSTIENALIPQLGEILEKNMTDFVPYSFQILGLLLDANDQTQVKDLYKALFSRLLTPDLWRTSANLPGLIRLFRAYFSKHQIFANDIKGAIQPLMERFQHFGLNNRKSEIVSFELLNAMFRYLPLEYYQSLIPTLLQVLLTKLQHLAQRENSPVVKAFVLSMSLLTFLHQDLLVPQAFQSVQAGLLPNVLRSVWIPIFTQMQKPQERNLCAVALARIMVHPEASSVLGECCEGLILLLDLRQSVNRTKAEATVEEEMEYMQEFEVSFSKLQNTDLQQDCDTYKMKNVNVPLYLKEALVPHSQSLTAITNFDLKPLFNYLN